jgi:hypothetical protein
MPIIQNLTLVNADRKKVWDKCHETNLGHYLFHIGINFIESTFQHCAHCWLKTIIARAETQAPRNTFTINFLSRKITNTKTY